MSYDGHYGSIILSLLNIIIILKYYYRENATTIRPINYGIFWFIGGFHGANMFINGNYANGIANEYGCWETHERSCLPSTGYCSYEFKRYIDSKCKLQFFMFLLVFCLFYQIIKSFQCGIFVINYLVDSEWLMDRVVLIFIMQITILTSVFIVKNMRYVAFRIYF